MGCIVCATRGGAGSRAVQQRAIQHARRTGHKLVFLYVLDISGLVDFDEKLTPAIQGELHWVGQVLLGVAQKRAENAQIASDIVVREGRVREEICHFLEEISADLLFLGAPRGTTAGILGDDTIEQFAASIEQRTGVAVEVVRPDAVEGGSP